MGRRRTYTAEFKREAVALTREPDRTVAEVARSLGIDRGVLRSWKVRMDADGPVGSPSDGRMAHTTRPSLSAASTARRPPQRGQRKTSTANTRRSNSSHGRRPQRRGRDDVVAHARRLLRLVRAAGTMAARIHAAGASTPWYVTLVRARRRHQRRQPRQEVQRLPHQAVRPARPRAPQLGRREHAPGMDGAPGLHARGPAFDPAWTTGP